MIRCGLHYYVTLVLSCSCLSLEYLNKHLRHNAKLLPKTDSQLYHHHQNAGFRVAHNNVKLNAGALPHFT